MGRFGQTVWLWRRHRGLTQAQLAQRTRMARPNLSAIERGRREVTLGTLRALAVALDVQPGVLADGVAPEAHRRGPLSSSRDTLERVADAVAFGRGVADPRERAVVEALTLLLGPRTQAVARPRHRATAFGRGPALRHRAGGRNVAPGGAWSQGAMPACRSLGAGRGSACGAPHWRTPRSSRRAVLTAWHTLTSLCSRDVINTLADRVAERKRIHEPHGH